MAVTRGSGERMVFLQWIGTADSAMWMLNGCWSVLRPGRRAVYIVPNRTGLWSRSDATPFGFGRPYSLSQLEKQLRDVGLIPVKTLSTLYQPPSPRKIWRQFAQTMEGAGRHIPVFAAGGVLMVEAAKQVPQPKRPGLAEAVKRPLRVLEGMGGPVVKPA